MNKVILILVAGVLLLPIWFLGIGSFQEMEGFFAMPPAWIPLEPTLDNYRWVFDRPVLLWGANTVVITVATVVLSTAVSCMAGYSFAFFDFRGKKWLWLTLLVGIMIPVISLIIPRFVVMRQLGIGGTRAAVILPALLVPGHLYLARNYFETIPRALLDSARIDGASEVQTLTRIVVPISKPIIACLAIFTAVGAMGDYLWPMLQLQHDSKRTLLIGPLGAVREYRGEVADMVINPLGRQFAVAMVLLVPILLVFFAASRYFTTALGGALKE